MKQPIYRFTTGCTAGFGDRWATANFILQTSEKSHQPTLVSKHYWHPEIGGIIQRLHSRGQFRLVDHPGNITAGYCDVYQGPFCRTENVWIPNTNNYVCFQFDGRYMAEVKNPDWHEHSVLFNFLKARGLSIIDVGNMRPLDDSIRLMSRARAFIGIPSGMSHVASSVRTPAFVICKPAMDIPFHLDCVYKRKPNVKLCASIGVLMQQFSPFLECNPGIFAFDKYATML